MGEVSLFLCNSFTFISTLACLSWDIYTLVVDFTLGIGLEQVAYCYLF